ncbi:hypothetical protein GEMRC1_002608 [Eukaryota sp. GEM-RC1]
MSTTLRSAVSKNKRRYVDAEYNLDLTYITPQVIAMGFPCMGVKALYRNPYPQVKAFLDHYHKDRFKVYNLCAEAPFQYEASLFDNRVAKFPFIDHAPPPFELIPRWCLDLEQWLINTSQVAAIHCKAGKGRTGLVICTWLVHSKESESAGEAISLYGRKRTHDGKGLTIPSQQRYVYYYDHYLKSLTIDPSISLDNFQHVLLTNFIVSHCPDVQSGARLCYTVKVSGSEVFNSTSVRRSSWAKLGDSVSLPACPLSLVNDFELNLYHVKPLGKRVKLARICLNSGFLPSNGNIVITKFEIDHVHKDKHHKTFHSDFSVNLYFFSPDNGLSIYDLLKEHEQSVVDSELLSSPDTDPESISDRLSENSSLEEVNDEGTTGFDEEAMIHTLSSTSSSENLGFFENLSETDSINGDGVTFVNFADSHIPCDFVPPVNRCETSPVSKHDLVEKATKSINFDSHDYSNVEFVIARLQIIEHNLSQI